MKPSNEDIMKAELLAHGISVCAGCTMTAEKIIPHGRAFADPDKRVIHYSKQGTIRNTLATFFHEIGHIIHGHGKRCKLRRYQREYQAEDYAKKSFRAYDIPYPRKRTALSRAYVQQWKRIGDKIKRSKNR